MAFVDCSPIIAGIGTIQENRLEDFYDAFLQIANSNWIFFWICGLIASTPCCILSALNVSKSMSAAYSTVLSSLRPLIVWVIFLIPWGPYLCRVQGQFHYTAVISFVTVISGVFVFKGLLSWSILKRVVNDTNYEKIQSLECHTENKDKNGVEKETGLITGHKMNGYVGNNYKAIGMK